MKAGKKTNWVMNPGYSVSTKISVRKKDSPFVTTNLKLEKLSREHIDLLVAISKTKHIGKVPPALKPYLKFLIDAGIVVNSDNTPKKVNASWKVGIKDIQFVPKIIRENAEQEVENKKLMVDKRFVFVQRGPQRPKAKFNGIPPFRDFPTGKALIWVFNPAYGVWAVFEMSENHTALVEQLLLGNKTVASLAPDLALLFFLGGIIGEPKLGSVIKNRHSDIECQRKHLKHNGYAVIKSLVNPLQIALMRRYFRDLEKGGYLEFDSHQVVNKRYIWHNDPMLQFVHRQSAGVVRQLSKENIFPSYSCLSAYLEGATLEKHLDRPQCAWNGSLLIDENPETAVEDSWPLYLEVRGQVHVVRLDFGDAIFYSGTTLPHWRVADQVGRRQTLGLLHYVPIDFVGSLD